MQVEKEITKEQVEEKNKSLQEISRFIFGDSAALRIVDPRELVLLKHNARYFKKDQFRQLISNIRSDKRLSSTPLCHIIDGGKLEVLSGNHRVQASIEAGLPWILVIVILQDIAKNEQIAIQLSHNALVGLDDEQILADLWNSIEDIKMKCYAGLSSDTAEKLKKIKLVSFSTPQIRTKQISFAFTETELEVVTDVLSELSLIPADHIYLAPVTQFADFFAAIQQVKKNDNIKNGSLAVMRLLEFAAQAMNNPQEEQA